MRLHSAARYPTTRELLIGQNDGAFISDQYFGQRMQMLNQQGGARFFGSDPNSLVELASSALPDDDMIQTFLGARDQVEINQMKDIFKSLPAPMQRAEFLLLAPQTQKLLLGQGYEVPEESFEKSWWQKAIGYKVFGHSLPTAPLKALTGLTSFGISTVGKAVMYPFDKSMGLVSHSIRTANAAVQSNNSIWSGSNWRQAWNDNKWADASYHMEAVDEVKSLIGDEEFERLKLFLAHGVDGVYEEMIDSGMSAQQASESFYGWYERLSDPDMEQSIKALSTNVNTEFLAVIDAYNAIPIMEDVTPDSLEGKVLGTVGSLGTMIMLDPTTHMFKLGKAWRATRLQMVPGKTRQSIELVRQAVKSLNASDEGFAAAVGSRKESKSVLEDMTEQFQDVFDRGKRFGYKRLVTSTKVLPLFLRKRVESIMAPMRSVNRAFVDERRLADETERLIREYSAQGDPLTAANAKIIAKENLSDLYDFNQLLRDYPMFTSVLETMRTWQRNQSNTFIHINKTDETMDVLTRDVAVKNANGQIVLADTEAAQAWSGKALKPGAVLEDVYEFSGLESVDGYFEFMSNPIGYEALVTTAATGIDFDTLLLPQAMGIRKKGEPLSVLARRLINKPIDFANIDSISDAMDNIREWTAEFLQQRGAWIAAHMKDEIVEVAPDFVKYAGWEKLEPVLDDDVLLSLMTAADKKERDLILKSLNIEPSEVELAVQGLSEMYEQTSKLATAAIYEAGYADEFFKFHEFDPRTLQGTHRWNPEKREWIPITGISYAAKARKNYLIQNLHPAGSKNSILQSLAIQGKGVFTQLMYHPASLAKKFTTYMPTQNFIDVMDTKTAIKEFRALSEMGLLAHMPRSAIDDYMHTFITGDETARWKVQLEFFTDFLGRSGALLHGGNDVQAFVNRFISHSAAKYGQLYGSDVASIGGIPQASGLIPSMFNKAHMSQLNVLPNWRELGAIARYMGFYRRLGWGLHLPTIDKLIARTWRPAVLLRLGYVPRNGGEELFSWMLREGPAAPIKERITREATGFGVFYDQYGVKTLKKIEEGDDQRGIIYGTVSKVWRSINELARVGDKAITQAAIKEEVVRQGAKWDFLSPEQKRNALDGTRAKILKEKKDKSFFGVSRSLFDWAETNFVRTHGGIQKNRLLGRLPSREDLARRIVGNDEEWVESVEILRDLMNHPTVLDQHMKHILGSFDTYINQNGTSLDNMMRRVSGAKTEQILTLGINYLETELSFIDAVTDAGNRAAAVKQRTGVMSDDPGHVAWAEEMGYLITDQLETDLSSLIGVRGAGLGEVLPADQARYEELVKRLRILKEQVIKDKAAVTTKTIKSSDGSEYTDTEIRPEQSTIVDLGDPQSGRFEGLVEGKDGKQFLPSETIPDRSGPGVIQFGTTPESAPISRGNMWGGKATESVEDHARNYNSYGVVRDNPDILYITEGNVEPIVQEGKRLKSTEMGDKLLNSETGKFKLAKQIEGVSQGELENVIIVPVKRSPGKEKNNYLTAGDNFEIEQRIIEIVKSIEAKWATGNFRRIVVPQHGFGGLIGLQDAAPEIHEMINRRIREALLKLEGKTDHPSLALKSKNKGDTSYNWKEYSKARGYSESHMNTYEEYLKVKNEVDAMGGKPVDETMRQYPPQSGDPSFEAQKSINVEGISAEKGTVAGRYRYDPETDTFLDPETGELLKGKELEQAQRIQAKQQAKEAETPQFISFDERIGALIQTLRSHPSLQNQFKVLRNDFYGKGPAQGIPYIDPIVEKMLPELQRLLPADVAESLFKFFHSTGSTNNVNAQAFLIRAITQPGFKVEKLNKNYDKVRGQAKTAMTNYYRSPEGQQALISLLRSKSGGWFPGTGPVQMAPAPGTSRVFIPMINGEDAKLLISKLPDAGTPRSSHVLEGKAATARIMHENNLQLKALLLEELEHLGVSNAAEKVASLIRPEGPVENYLLNAAEWMGKERATAMPLAIMTSDPEIAKGISRAVDRWLHGTEKGAGTSSISTKTIQSHELLSTEARAAAAQGVDNVPLMGFGDDHYFGISASGQRLPASEFEEGLSRELVWGTHLSEVSAGSGLDVVPVLQGEPQVYKNVVWKETNTGRVLIQRVGEPIPKLAQSFTGSEKTQNWVRVEEFFSTNNDLHNAATEIAAVNTLEAEHLLTSGSRSTGSQNIEVFYPWLDAVEDTENFIDTAALEELTTSGQWWGKGPERLLGYVPMTNEGGTALERMDKAWNTVLRNWFDGVVNPAIGAMVREPLFHYHFIKSYKQTEDVRSMHGHSKFAYPKLRDKRKELWRKGFIRLEGDQVRIDAFDDFIRMEWPVAKADSGFIKDLVDALESADLNKLKGVLKSDGLKAAVDANENEQLRDFFTVLTRKAVGGDLNDDVLEQFMSWANNRKLQFDRHRDVAIRRALHVTSNFIDDHRIRSQFQGMVGTMIPFWFAEDQFLRRVGRSFNHNPLIFRNANLWMMAGVHSGLVQEDQFGNKRLIYPGSGMLTRAAFEIVDNTPIVNQFFAGDLASVVKGDLTTNINVIPGYNFNRQEGEGFFEDEGLLESDMGFGPILAVPIQWASQIDPSIRHSFDNNLIGARYVDYPLTDSPTAAFSPSAAFNQMIGSITPALVQQGKDTASSLLNLAGQMDDPAARSKAAMDVVILRWMNDRLPTEAEIARQSNPAVYKERLFDEINAEATQLQLLQTMSWFFGPGTANFSDLVLKNDAWEWNQEFYDLLDKGLPYEEAYRMWQERIIAADGEFNAYEYSPFISKRGKKIPLAAMDATQEANSWLTTNKEFVQTYDLAGAFFMPRRFESDDDEYSAEARSRQIAYGLFEMQTPEEFLDQMYFRASFSTYQSKKAEYQRQKFSMRARELDTTEVTANWNAWATAYMDTHPVFAANMQGGDSKQKREATIEQFRRIVVDSSQIPDTKYRQDILMAMNAIVLFKDEMDALQNIPSSTAKRNDIKLKYYNYITANVTGKPWLNEMYYSVFMPLIGDTWLAKLEVGLLEFPRSVA